MVKFGGWRRNQVLGTWLVHEIFPRLQTTVQILFEGRREVAQGRMVIRRLQLRNGKVPFDEWFNSLDRRSQAVVTARLTRVRSGNLGDCKRVRGGVLNCGSISVQGSEFISESAVKRL